MLTGKEKRLLRAEGNRLKAEVWIGKEGISAGSITTIENSFNTKELVKIKLQDNCPQDKKEVAEMLCQKTGAELIQILGNTLLLYRPFPEEES
ncbi:MAG: ribosome assembly RNA-binding protein YhbY [Calditrichia bacterium]